MNVLVGWLMVTVLLAGPEQKVAAETQPASPQQVAAEAEQPTAPVPVFGEVLPEIKAAAWLPGDQEVSLASLRGKFVVIEFWKTDCQFCRKSMLIMEDLKNKFADRVAVFALSREEPDKVAAFLEKHPAGYRIGVGSVTSSEWQVDKVPRMYLADPEGRLIYVCKPQEMEAVLREALAGKYPLCADLEQVAKYEAQLAELERRTGRGDHARVWADTFGLRSKFPIKHPVYDRAKKLMMLQVKVGKQKLGRAKALISQNKKDEARELLQEVMRDYEGALLEREAAKLLRSLETTP